MATLGFIGVLLCKVLWIYIEQLIHMQQTSNYTAKDGIWPNNTEHVSQVGDLLATFSEVWKLNWIFDIFGIKFGRKLLTIG